jgi:large subunit ribosomal protein L4
MPTVDVMNTAGKKVGEMTLSDAVFGATVNENLFFETVRWQLAKARQGNAATKGRSYISGSTRKLYRQKGTGRARRGDIKSPTLRGGGTLFGPTPRDYGYALPKKVRKAALRSALSKRLAESHLIVLEGFDLAKAKTKEAVAVLGRLGLANVLIIDSENHTLDLSTRNIHKVKYLPPEGLNVADILRYESVLLTKKAVEAVEGRLQ